MSVMHRIVVKFFFGLLVSFARILLDFLLVPFSRLMMIPSGLICNLNIAIRAFSKCTFRLHRLLRNCWLWRRSSRLWQQRLRRRSRRRRRRLLRHRCGSRAFRHLCRLFFNCGQRWWNLPLHRNFLCWLWDFAEDLRRRSRVLRRRWHVRFRLRLWHNQSSCFWIHAALLDSCNSHVWSSMQKCSNDFIHHAGDAWSTKISDFLVVLIMRKLWRRHSCFRCSFFLSRTLSTSLTSFCFSLLVLPFPFIFSTIVFNTLSVAGLLIRRRRLR